MVDLTQKVDCPNHRPSPDLGYIAASADADRRLKRREHQRLCPKCNRWEWEEYLIDFTGAIRDDYHQREQERKERERRRQRGIYRGRVS